MPRLSPRRRSPRTLPRAASPRPPLGCESRSLDVGECGVLPQVLVGDHAGSIDEPLVALLVEQERALQEGIRDLDRDLDVEQELVIRSEVILLREQTD